MLMELLAALVSSGDEELFCVVEHDDKITPTVIKWITIFVRNFMFVILCSI